MRDFITVPKEETASLEIPVYETVLNYKNGSTHELPVKIYNPDRYKSAYIVVPGFQSPSVRDGGNKELHHALASKGDCVIAFDYSGTRYTEKVRDKFTFESFVEDTLEVVDTFAYKGHTFISSSYGVNVAARAITKSTEALISAVPAPDFIQKAILPKIKERPLKEIFGIAAVLAWNGYYFPPKRGMDSNRIKLTFSFLNSASRGKNQLQNILEQAAYKPPVRIVRNENDNFANKLGARELENIFKEKGFTCKTFIAEERAHQIKPGTIEKIMEALRDLREEPAPA